MRLSTVFELLLIFLLIAFAASRVIDSKDVEEARKITTKKDQRQENAINKYCNCTESLCNCCREFRVPIVNLNGPGCAVLKYTPEDNLSVALSFADRVITTQQLSGRKPRPVCMPLPGGYSKFCGRVYNIGRQEEDFKACLGFELQSQSTVEAALRVSCFRFGSRGVSTEPAEPLPLAVEVTEGDDDDDDDDDFGLGGVIGDDDDDDDDDEDDDDDDDDDDEDDDDDADDDAADADSPDYTGFSTYLGDLFGTGSSSGSKKPNKKKTPASTAKPAVVAKPTGSQKPKPVRKPSKTQVRVTTAKPVPAETPAATTTVYEEIITEVQSTSAAPVKNSNPLNLLHTSALLQLANKPEEQNDVAVPSSVLANSDEPESKPTMQKVPLITVDKTRPRPGALVANTHATPIQDLGIQSSISHITGQLSDVPVTTIVSSTKPMNEKAGAAKPESSVSEENASANDDDDEDEDEDSEGVEVVDKFDDDDDSEASLEDDDPTSINEEDLDSNSEDKLEDDDEDEDDEADEEEVSTEKPKPGKKKKKTKHEDEEDDDEDVDLLGAFGLTDKKTKKVKKGKPTNNGVKKDEEEDYLGLGSLGFRRFGDRVRGRQNKMLRI